MLPGRLELYDSCSIQLTALLLQCSSYGESISTLGFGSRVSEITLGQAKKNSESAQIFEAKDQVIRCVKQQAVHQTLLAVRYCSHVSLHHVHALTPTGSAARPTRHCLSRA